MSRNSNRAGFVPAQATSAVQSLDFDAAAETFARALALDGTGKTEDETAQIADRIASAADRLLSVKPTNTAQIALKMEAYGWLNGFTTRLSDADVQARIIAGHDDRAKGLLALYFDLAAVSGFAPPAGERTWQTVAARWEAYQRETGRLEAAQDEEPDGFEFPPEHRREFLEAHAELLATDPTDWSGVAVKALLLRSYAKGDVWEPEWKPDPEAGGWEGEWAKLLTACEQLGDTDPTSAERLDVLRAVAAAESMACEALHDPNGYASYGSNPGALSDMVEIIGTVQTDARRLAGSTTRTDFLAVAAIDAVWFGDLPAELVKLVASDTGAGQ